MSQPADIDGVIVQWGDRLFYPANRIVKSAPTPDLAAAAARQRAKAIRQRVQATVVRRAPQVMVKVTGGGRGMRAIVAHFRYISQNGSLDVEDDRGGTVRGRDELRALASEWRVGGSLIGEHSDRREAFNIMLSMPCGTDPSIVQRSAREFARIELADHSYVMVLHDHQANPHVHLSVRAESRLGKRLNPRKADLHRWRETFAERLRSYGVQAEATRQLTRGRLHRFDPIWRLKAVEDGRLRTAPPRRESEGERLRFTGEAAAAWLGLGQALAGSHDPQDRALAGAVAAFVSSPAPHDARVQPRMDGPEPRPASLRTPSRSSSFDRLR